MAKGKGSERRQFTRIPIAADLGEPVEIEIAQNGSKNKKTVPAILANISVGGMALIAFGSKDLFNEDSKIQLIANLPGLAKAKINGKIMHVRSRLEMHTLGVRFVALTTDVRSRIDRLIEDYDDCETRISLAVPEACTGSICRYFGLCKKTQKLSPAAVPAKRSKK